MLSGGTHKPFCQLCDDGNGIACIHIEYFADSKTTRLDTLIDQYIQQLIAGLEVVMEHGWRNASFARNGGERGVGDALPGKQNKRRVQ